MVYALRHLGAEPLPIPDDIAALPFADRWLVWCARRIALAQERDNVPCPLLDGALAAAGLAPAAGCLYAAFAELATHSLRRPDFRHPRARRVSGDERAFVRLIAALQRGDGATAGALLRRWLRPADCESVAQPAHRFAVALARRGYWARSCTDPHSTGPLVDCRRLH